MLPDNFSKLDKDLFKALENWYINTWRNRSWKRDTFFERRVPVTFNVGCHGEELGLLCPVTASGELAYFAAVKGVENIFT